MQRGGVSDDALAPCVLEPSGSGVDGDANIQQFEAQEYFIAREQVDPSFFETGWSFVAAQPSETLQTCEGFG